MSANVESMFYVSTNSAGEIDSRKVPWHGLGTPVMKALNSEEALDMAGLNWEVKSEPIFDSKQLQIPGYFRNYRESDNATLGVVSSRYKIVQNTEAFEFTDSLIGEECSYETAGSLDGGKRIWLLAKLPGQKILDDEFENYVAFTNTHDGTGAIQVCVTPIRVVCQNTLNLALNGASRKWSTRHMGDLKSKLEEGKRTLELATIYMHNLNEEANKLAEVKVDDVKVEWMFDNIFPVDYNKDTQRKIDNVQKMKEAFFNCMKANDISQYKGTAWGVINATTDFVDHVAPNRLTETYQEKNWGKIMLGHPVVDKMYSLIQSHAGVAA